MEEIKKKYMEKTTALLTAAFGLVAALAWNDAIQALFKSIFGEASEIWAKFIYAVVITLVIVIIMIILEKHSK